MSQLKIKNQKIIKVGNSLAITLDRKFLDRARLQEGSELIVRYDEENSSVTFAPPSTYSATTETGKLSVAEKKAVYTTKVNPELKEWTDKFLEENKEALKELANL